jgi:hypothetical protein
MVTFILSSYIFSRLTALVNVHMMYKWFMAFLYPGFELIQKLFFLLYIHVLIFTHFDMFFRSIFIRFDMYLCLFSHPSICFYVYAHTLRYVSMFMLIHFDMFLYLCLYTSICFYIYAHTLRYVSIFMLIHFNMFLYLCSYTSLCFYIIFVHLDMFQRHRYLNG